MRGIGRDEGDIDGSAEGLTDGCGEEPRDGLNVG